MRPLRAIGLALFAATITACASTPRPSPTLAEYTAGASSWRDEVARISSASPPEAGEIPTALGPIAARADEWRRLAALPFRTEVDIVDFPPDPDEQAELRLRVVLEGETRDRAGRLRADDLWSLSLARRGRGSWRPVGARALRLDPIRQGRPHLREVSAEVGLAGVVHATTEPVEETNISMPATHHHAGVLLLDYDGDGRLDILVPGIRPRLFRNEGGELSRRFGRGRARPASGGAGGGWGGGGPRRRWIPGSSS